QFERPGGFGDRRRMSAVGHVAVTGTVGAIEYATEGAFIGSENRTWTAELVGTAVASADGAVALTWGATMGSTGGPAARTFPIGAERATTRHRTAIPRHVRGSGPSLIVPRIPSPIVRRSRAR